MTSTENVRVIVVWCDSPSGLVSTRVDSNDRIVQYSETQLPDIKLCILPSEVFDILKKQDGTKIAIPVVLVSDILGWDIEYTNGHSPEPIASSGFGA